MSLRIKILEMEFQKPKFKKRTYGGPRNDRSSGYTSSRNDRSSGYTSSRNDRSSGYTGSRNDRGSGYRGPRDDRSSGYRGPRDDKSSGYNRDSRSGGSRFNRNDRSSRFNQGSEDNRRRETFKATCGDCGDECQIPFKPKYDRPVYCRKCFQDHKPQERSGGSGFNRGTSYGRNERSSRYNQGPPRFQRDRTPIHSRSNFGTTKYPPNRNESYQKNFREYNSNNSNSFYSTMRKKLFVVLGEKKCVNCGFDDERALGFEQTDDVTSFDFIQRAGTASSWEKYISEPDLAKKKLQVICLNCNMIKQKELD